MATNKEINIPQLVQDISGLRENFEILIDGYIEELEAEDAIAEEVNRDYYLQSIDQMLTVLSQYTPTYTELQECLKAREQLKEEVTALKQLPSRKLSSTVEQIAALKAAKGPSAAPSLAQRIRKSATVATKKRTAPPRRTRCQERSEQDCVVEGERNPCHWHEEQCITGTQFKKATGVKTVRTKRAGPARKGSKADLTNEIKGLLSELRVTPADFNIHLKKVYDGRTLSRLMIPQLMEVLVALEAGDLPGGTM